MNYIHLLFDTFLTNVSDRFNIPKSDVESEWEKACACHISHKPIITLIENGENGENVDKNTKNVKNSQNMQCSYIYTKSGRFFKKGDQCKKDCKQPYNTYNTCEKHMSCEKNTKNDENKKNDEKTIEKIQENVKKNVILKLNHVIKRYVHTMTRLVFYSNSERVVFAKLEDDDVTLIRLTEMDIELCKYYGFKANPSLFL